MFLKIKLEHQDGVEKDSPHIEIRKEASISEIAHELESYLDIPADCMEIRTLGRVYKEHDKLHCLWEQEQKEGASIMLYTYKYNYDYDYYEEEPHFHCFLQMFETKAALMASSFKNRPVQRQISEAASSDTFITISDSDDRPDVNEKRKSSSESESTSTSSESTDSSDSSETPRKRCRSSPQVEKNKRASSVQPQNTKMPAKLAKFLDEFPCYPSEPTQSSDETVREKPTIKATSKPPSVESAVSPLKSIAVEAHKKLDNANLPSSTTSSKPDSNALTPPSAFESITKNISPEKREFIVLIINTENSIQQSECLPILNVFIEKFHQSMQKQLATLNFNNCDSESAFKLHDGKLWIICDDDVTCGWLLESAKRLPTKYRTEKFTNYFQQRAYTVVIPNVCKSNEMLEVFQLLQKQNDNLDNISLWTVDKKRHAITGKDDKHFAKVVCHFCANELLTIGIDKDSAARLAT